MTETPQFGILKIVNMATLIRKIFKIGVLLGASILTDGNLSPILKDRVDTAIKLYEAKKVDKILVTGDNSTVSYNEVSPVRIYLLEKGIHVQY